MTFQKLGKEFQELRDEYRRGMPEKLDRVEKLWAIVSTSKSVGRPLQELCRELHTVGCGPGTLRGGTGGRRDRIRQQARRTGRPRTRPARALHDPGRERRLRGRRST